MLVKDKVHIATDQVIDIVRPLMTYPRQVLQQGLGTTKKLANIFDSTVGYQLGGAEKVNLFKDPATLKKMADIKSLPEKDKECLLFTVDNFINATKLNRL